MKKHKFSGPMTAEELMARLEADPEWVAKNRAREEKWAEVSRSLAENQAPIIHDLAQNGINTNSIDDLRVSKYPKAIPILLKHLEAFDAYDQRIRGGIADALADKTAKRIIPRLLEIYQKDPDRSLNIGKGAIANTICELAGRRYIREIAALALDQRHGAARARLIGHLGESKSKIAKEALERLRDDPCSEVSLRAQDMLDKMHAEDSKGRKIRRKDYRLIATTNPSAHADKTIARDGSIEFKRPFLMPKTRRGLSEASASFDADRLPGFFAQVGEVGLTSKITDAIIAELATMEISAERLLEFKVEFDGRTIPLQVLLYLEDTDAPSVYFFSTHDLTAAIDRVMGEWMDAE